MKRHFHEELKIFKAELLKMATLTEEAIHKSIEALKTQDKALAQSVINNDKSIDIMELDNEKIAMNLLALHQPMAADLRFIATGMKINAELERIADLTVNISQRVLSIADKPLVKPLIDIPKLSDLAKKMVKGAIDSFVNESQEMAKDVIFTDAQADKLRNLIYNELVYDYLAKDGSIAPRAVPLILVSRHLERICDHATYIAEDVIYMVKAKVVKHNPKELENNNK